MKIKPHKQWQILQVGLAKDQAQQRLVLVCLAAALAQHVIMALAMVSSTAAMRHVAVYLVVAVISTLVCVSLLQEQTQFGKFAVVMMR